MSVAEVRLWGNRIGAVSTEEGMDFAFFQYDPAFAREGIEISPMVMPLSEEVYSFPELSLNSFHGLPGLLADSLPDKYGNALIDAWLATQGRTPDSFNAVERLCYTGTRGMGALEFHPVLGPDPKQSHKIKVDALVDLASEVLMKRHHLRGHFHRESVNETMGDILQVGTSAGGARAKAVIAWNPRTNEVWSGQVEVGHGFEYWLLKFDGVSGNKDKELEDPKGYGTLEYAYHLMAKAAGIQMSECRLMEEGGRKHFMTRRFDRLGGGRKLHMQSMCALAHLDFNHAGAHSYEQAFQIIKALGLPMASVEEQYRRMIFNVVARNQDDHVKNIAFLMNQDGDWLLSPAFDLTYSYNPNGAWTANHQMTINGKRDHFLMEDLKACANVAGMKRDRYKRILEEVISQVENWSHFAGQAGLREQLMEEVRQNFRMQFAGK